MNRKRVLIVGSSRGIGEEIVKYCSSKEYEVYGVSRSKSENCIWIKADISKPEAIELIKEKIQDLTIDLLIFSSGIWENYGFTQEFDFRKTSYEESLNIMAVNLIAPIEISKAISKNLALSPNPRAIYLGALSGLENLGSSQVAYSSSKFALRGAIQGLRKALKEENIGFTVINPGNVGTKEVLQDIKEGRFTQQTPIPISDIISSIEFISNISSSVEIGDINLIQK